MKPKHFWYSIPVICVEVATANNTFHYFSYHEEPIPAVLLSVSFSVLLMASAVLIARDIPWLIKAMLMVGAFALFGAQSIANISESFLYARYVLPADQLVPLWQQSALDIRVLSSIIYGGVLNLLGALYWLALSFYFRADSADAKAVLEDLTNRMFRRAG